MAVFFSGHGKDGAAGAALVKNAGGKILVQNVHSCYTSSIPCELIKATTADTIVEPGEMPG
ncbi:chemotaxis protein CheB [Ferruginibacter sp.]|uniref:chemotaxis protein CheB n=1 Tax=Ferruginibacter sp. TaxID=1940288 RepID=UPI003466FA98